MKNFFKILFRVFTVALVLTVFCLCASAVDAQNGSIVDGSVTYTWDFNGNETLTIGTEQGGWKKVAIGKICADSTYSSFIETNGSDVKKLIFTESVYQINGGTISNLGKVNGTGTQYFSALETIAFENSQMQFVGAPDYGWFNNLQKLKYVYIGNTSSDCVDLSALKNIAGSISNTSCLTDLFGGCSSIEKVIMPATGPYYWSKTDNKAAYLDAITAKMFANCTALSEIEIPSWVTSIETGAFMSCRSLGSIYIPETVTSIADDAFSWCGTLEIICDSEESVAYKYVENFDSSKYGTKITAKIKADPTWEEFVTENPLAAGVKTEGTYEKGNYAFSWNYDRVSGTLTVVPSKDLTANGLVNKFDISEWSAGLEVGTFVKDYSAYIKHILLPEIQIDGTTASINQIWVENDNSYDLSDMKYLESFTFATDLIQLQDLMLTDCPNITTLGKIGTENGTIDFTNVKFIGGTSDFFGSCAHDGVKRAVVTDGALTRNILTGTFTSDIEVYLKSNTLTTDAITSILASDGINYKNVKFMVAEISNSAVAFDGYQTRVKDYNGLRGRFHYDNSITNEGWKLTDFGALTWADDGNEYTLKNITENNRLVNTVVFENGSLVNKYMDENGQIIFVVTVINIKDANYTSKIAMRSYEIWTNELGETFVKYGDVESYSIYEITLALYKDGNLNRYNDTLGFDILMNAPQMTLETLDYTDPYGLGYVNGLSGGEEFVLSDVQVYNADGVAVSNVKAYIFKDFGKNDGKYVLIYRAENETATLSHEIGLGQFASEWNGLYKTEDGKAIHPCLGTSVTENILSIVYDVSE